MIYDVSNELAEFVMCQISSRVDGSTIDKAALSIFKSPTHSKLQCYCHGAPPGILLIDPVPTVDGRNPASGEILIKP